MRVEVDEPCPLPDDPALAEVARALSDTGHWGWVVDAGWRVVYASEEQRLSFGGTMQMVPVVIGEHLFGTAALRVSTESPFGTNKPELWRGFFSDIGGLVLNDTPGGCDELRALVDPSLRDLVEGLAPDAATGKSFSFVGAGVDGYFEVRSTAVRVRDAEGKLRGTVLVSKPAAGMSMLAVMAFERDPRHLERMQRVASASRRPTAILFGDLEASSALARRLSTASYFALGRRIVRAADECVVAAGGLPGRHVGDGVVAFFSAETFDSESGAARACITAARALRTAMIEVARRSDLTVGDVVMRFGLHWGSTLYLGNITTTARTEVTALGDEVNEAARIEACATGGRILASKSLVERLDSNDARALQLDPDHVTYVQLADLDTATDKARRDAPAIAVCEM
jgi:class 3 adenylate cyclase